MAGGYLSREGGRSQRGSALAGTVLVHLVLLLGLSLNLFRPGLGVGHAGGASLSVFNLESGPPSVLALSSSLPATRPSPPAAAAVPADVQEIITPESQADGGGGGADPFAGSALTPAAVLDHPISPAVGAAAALSAGTPIPDKKAVDELLRMFRETHSDAAGEASFALTVMPDGSVEDVRFIAGSLGADVGLALAQFLQSRKIYAGTGVGAVRTVLGPISLG